jgi:hypothetical protein
MDNNYLRFIHIMNNIPIELQYHIYLFLPKPMIPTHVFNSKYFTNRWLPLHRKWVTLSDRRAKIFISCLYCDGYCSDTNDQIIKLLYEDDNVLAFCATSSGGDRDDEDEYIYCDCKGYVDFKNRPWYQRVLGKKSKIVAHGNIEVYYHGKRYCKGQYQNGKRHGTWQIDYMDLNDDGKSSFPQYDNGTKLNGEMNFLF